MTEEGEKLFFKLIEISNELKRIYDSKKWGVILIACDLENPYNTSYVSGVKRKLSISYLEDCAEMEKAILNDLPPQPRRIRNDKSSQARSRD